MKTSENIHLLSMCDLCISGRLCALIPARLIMSLSVYNGYHAGFAGMCVMPRVRSWGHIVAPSLCWLMSCEQMQQATWLTTDPSNLRQQSRARAHSATEDSDSLVFLSVFSFDHLPHCTFLANFIPPLSAVFLQQRTDPLSRLRCRHGALGQGAVPQLHDRLNHRVADVAAGENVPGLKRGGCRRGDEREAEEAER